MMDDHIIIETEALNQQLDRADQVIIDLCKPEMYQLGHIPGALHLDYAHIISAQPPVMGLLPEPTTFGQTLSRLGITPSHRVIAYDDEGGGKASRLLWTLAACGHEKLALLNGGRHAWGAEQRPLDNRITETTASGDYPVSFDDSPVVASRQYILDHLDDDAVVLLDARSPAEYTGADVRAARTGHIPGAVNLDWTELMDRSNQLRLKPAGALQQRLTQLGITPDKEIIAYCQTHHRSALSFIALKSLGFERVRGYPGAWSDWGNQADTPIEN